MDADAADGLLIAKILELLESGPARLDSLLPTLDELGLLDHLRDEGVADDEMVEAVVDALEAVDALWLTPDRTLALTRQLVEGMVLTHRLTAAERDSGAIVRSPDLEAFELDDDSGIELSGIGRLQWAFDLEGGVLQGPAGWLDRFEAGDLLAFRQSGSTLSIEPADDLDDAVAEQEVLRAAVEMRIPHGAGEDSYPLVLDVLTLQPSLFRRAVAPIGELLAAIGLERRGSEFGRADESWRSFAERRSRSREAHIERRFGLERCCRHALDVVRAAYQAKDDIDVGAVARALGHGTVAAAFGASVLHDERGGDERLAAFADRLAERASSKLRAGALVLRALELQARGETLDAEAAARAALVADPDLDSAALVLAEYELDRGNLGHAATLLRRGNVVDEEWIAGIDSTRRALAEPYRGVGRNDACPCGSGRKFKACCQRAPKVSPELLLDVVTKKLVTEATRPVNRSTVVGLASSTIDPDDPELMDSLIARTGDRFVIDLAIFEGGIGERYLDERGVLLPDDERALLERMLDADRRLWEIVEVDRGRALRLRDVKTGESVTVTEQLGSEHAEVGSFLLTRVVAVGTEHKLVGIAIDVSLRLRESVIELLDGYVDADALAAWYGWALQPPELTTKHGERMLLCTTVLATDASLDEVHAALDPRFEVNDDSWVELEPGEGDGRTVLGSVEWKDGELHLFAMSEPRHERLLATVTGALPDARVVRDERVDPLEMMRRGAMPAREPVEPSPELDEALQELIRQKEREWIDQSIPALGGLTPKQALDDPTRREELLALLRETEARGDVLRGFDAGRLRALLGIESSER